jgi:hypothetical protein
MLNDYIRPRRGPPFPAVCTETLVRVTASRCRLSNALARAAHPIPSQWVGIGGLRRSAACRGLKFASQCTVRC